MRGELDCVFVCVYVLERKIRFPVVRLDIHLVVIVGNKGIEFVWLFRGGKKRERKNLCVCVCV